MKTKIWKCTKITGAFWLLVFFGPILVKLLHAANNYLAGGGIFQELLDYAIAFFSQALACVAACEAAKALAKDDHKICVLVNQIIAFFVLIALAIFTIFTIGKIIDGASLAASAVVPIVYSVLTIKSLRQKK